MIRPSEFRGGAITAEQWQSLHQVSEEFGTGTLKITTRQTVQASRYLKTRNKTNNSGV